MRLGRRVTPELLEEAMYLRSVGLSYHAISEVMQHFRDVWVTPDTWRHRLREAGSPPKYHGTPTGLKKAAI